MSRFKILWIDDQKEKCRKDVKQVKQIVTELGFEPDIIVEDDISEYSLKDTDGTLNKMIHARDVDLYVIDYNLKNELFGGDVVEEIRRNHDIYSDIVFYSSIASSLIEPVKASFDSDSIMKFFDGVYIAPLGDEFLEKIGYIIEKTIKSWYNVHSIRGVLLSKASKFEHMVNSIISSCYEPCLAQIKTALNIKGDNILTNIKDKWQKVDTKDDPIPLILSDPISFNWAIKRKIIDTMIDCNAIEIDNWTEIKEIFDLRNKFAHNPIHLVNGELIVSMKSCEETYTEKDVDKLREKLMSAEQSLDKLLKSDRST